MVDLKQRAEQIIDDLLYYRRSIHKNPEIGNELPLTTAFVKKELEKMGYMVNEIAKSALSCEIGNGQGKTILLRADMDALPIIEETNLIFKSNNQNMHACGHDLHTAILLGVAKILKPLEGTIPGTIKLMFQPAEEILSGALAMIDAGILEQPPVDCALALHMSSQLSDADLLIQEGPCGASADIFKITVKGKSSHGAMPEHGIDSILIASNIVLNLQTILTREISSLDPVVLTIGRFDAGFALNIIAEQASLQGTIRTFSEENRKKIKKRVVEISKKTAEAFNGSAEIEFLHGTPVLYNDPLLIQKMRPFIEEITLNYSIEQKKGMGSEDFAYIAEKVPSIFFSLPAAVSDKPYTHHHPKVDFDEKKMCLGVAILATCALNYLKTESEGK